MSLGSALDAPNSRLRRWLDQRFDGVRAVQADYRNRERPDLLVEPGDEARGWSSAIGTVVDHRLRLCFTVEEPATRVARKGVNSCMFQAMMLRDTDRADGKRWALRATLGNGIIKKITEAASELALDDRGQPLRRSKQNEVLLARLLVCATWFQILIRGGVGAFAATPLWDIERYRNISAILQEIPDSVIDDILAQLDVAGESDLEQLRRHSLSKTCHPGPTFAGSEGVGGADADIVIDRLLLDYKSSVRINSLSARDARQLLCYALLDFDGACQIEQVGLYLTRTGDLVTWTLGDYISLFGSSEAVSTLRSEVMQLAREGPQDQVI